MTLVQDTRQAISRNEIPEFWYASFGDMTPEDAITEAHGMGISVHAYTILTYDMLADVHGSNEMEERDEWIDAVREVLDAHS